MGYKETLKLALTENKMKFKEDSNMETEKDEKKQELPLPGEKTEAAMGGEATEPKEEEKKEEQTPVEEPKKEEKKEAVEEKTDLTKVIEILHAYSQRLVAIENEIAALKKAEEKEELPAAPSTPSAPESPKEPMTEAYIFRETFGESIVQVNKKNEERKAIREVLKL